MLNNYALLTHKGCPDGSACAICFILAGGARENVFFTHPNHEASDECFQKIIDKGFENILIADCSISLEIAEKIEQLQLNVTLLDHHKTAIPLKKYKWCYVDEKNDACGSKLLFDYLKSRLSDQEIKSYKEFFDLIDDHDRWVKNYKQSEELASLHGIIGQKLFIDRFIKNSSLQFTNEERYVLDLENKKFEEMVEEKRKSVQSSIHTINIDGKPYRFGFIMGAAKFVSSLSEILYLDPTLNIDVVVSISAEAVSLRSRKGSNIDVADLAKKFGGGGHASASGIRLECLLGKSLINFVSDKLKS